MNGLGRFKTIAFSLAIVVLPLWLHASDEKIADVVDVVSKAIVNIRTEELSGYLKRCQGR